VSEWERGEPTPAFAGACFSRLPQVGNLSRYDCHMDYLILIAWYLVVGGLSAWVSFGSGARLLAPTLGAALWLILGSTLFPTLGGRAVTDRRMREHSVRLVGWVVFFPVTAFFLAALLSRMLRLAVVGYFFPNVVLVGMDEFAP